MIQPDLIYLSQRYPYYLKMRWAYFARKQETAARPAMGQNQPTYFSRAGLAYGLTGSLRTVVHRCGLFQLPSS